MSDGEAHNGTSDRESPRANGESNSSTRPDPESSSSTSETDEQDSSSGLSLPSPKSASSKKPKDISLSERLQRLTGKNSQRLEELGENTSTSQDQSSSPRRSPDLSFISSLTSRSKHESATDESASRRAEASSPSDEPESSNDEPRRDSTPDVAEDTHSPSRPAMADEHSEATSNKPQDARGEFEEDDEFDSDELARTDRITSLPFDVVSEDGQPEFDKENDDAPEQRSSVEATADGFASPGSEDSGPFDEVDDDVASAGPEESGPFDEVGDDSTDRMTTLPTEDDESISARGATVDDQPDDSTDRIPSGFDDDFQLDDSTDRISSDVATDEASAAPNAPFDSTERPSDPAPSSDTGQPVLETTPETMDPADGVQALTEPPVDIEDEALRSAGADEITEHRRDTEESGPVGILEDPSSPSPETTDEAPDSSAEFEVEDTELYQSPYDNDPISARLSTLEGPAVGQDFLVNRMRNSVGRGTTNTISVPDPAMSRKHFEIIQNPDQSYLLRDLRSVNGTEINGVAVKEADLFHGDRIEAGQTTLQFIIPGDAPVDDGQRHLVPSEATETLSDEPAPTPKGPQSDDTDPMIRLMGFIAIGATVLSLPLLGFLVYAVAFDDPDDPEASKSAHELYFEGVEAFQAREWDEAEQLFEQSRQLNPEVGRVDAQLERIEDKRRTKELIQEVQNQDPDEFDDDDLDELRSIPEGHPYYDDARTELARVPHDEAQLLLVDARHAFDDGDWDRSADLVDEVLAIESDHPEAAELKEAIAEARDTEPKDPQDEATDEPPQPTGDDEPVAAASPDPTSPSPAVSSEPSPAGADEDEDTASPLADPFASTDDTPQDSGSDQGLEINFTDGFDLYRAERFEEALEHFDTIADGYSGTISERAERTADNIRRVHQSMKAAEQARQSDDYGEVVSQMEQAARADEMVVDGGSLGSSFTDKRVDALGQLGLQQLADEEYADAYDTLQRAEVHRADHHRVDELRDELHLQAESLIERAKDEKGSSPGEATSLLETVTAMVSPSSDPHQRARQLLDELD